MHCVMLCKSVHLQFKFYLQNNETLFNDIIFSYFVLEFEGDHR